MEDLNLFYESQGMNNYICIKVTEELSRYQVKMLECNEIPGLLSMHGTVMNGVCKLHYDITKMQRLSDALREGLGGQQARKLLLDIMQSLLKVEDYLLSFTRCVLTPDYVYVTQGQKIGILYLPYAEKTVLSVDAVRMFYQNILAEYLTDDNDIYFLNLLKYVNKQDFSIAGLLEKLKEGVEANTGDEQRERMKQNAPVASERESIGMFGKFPMPDKNNENTSEKTQTAKKAILEFPSRKEKEEKKTEKQEEKKAKEQVAAADIGFMVPGMENRQEEKAVVKEDKKKKEPAEKKQGLFGGLFGGGKKAAEKEEKISIPTSGSKALKDSAGKQQNYVPENTRQDMYPSGNSGGWSGTVMLETEGAKTEMLGMQNAPRLLHNGSAVVLNHFPFRIGNGKVEGMDYVIPKGVISKNHASIQCSQGRYYIKDENSSNHTYLNGKQLPPFTEFEIGSGDVIRLANEEMTFEE